MILWIDFGRKEKAECVPLSVSEELLRDKIQEIKHIEYWALLVQEGDFSFKTKLPKEIWIKALGNRKYFVVKEYMKEGVFCELCMSKKDVIDMLKTGAELGDFGVKTLSEIAIFEVEKSEAILVYVKEDTIHVVMLGESNKDLTK